MQQETAICPEVILKLKQGKVIAYPTEAVYGLGCDPDNACAVDKILAIKQRPISKGLILIASNFSQLKPYIDHQQLNAHQLDTIMQTWPGPTTWVMPAAKTTPRWITGDFDSIAVRVTQHPVVRQLCQALGKPLISTSANLSGQPAINDFDELLAQMSELVDHIVAGEVDSQMTPSKIIDALSGAVYRS